MEKQKMETTGVVEGNIDKIRVLFPHCITEIKGADGKIRYAVDFDKLRAELGDDMVEGQRERYQFTWPQKSVASALANTPTRMTLRPDRESSVDFDNTENLYIEGDNLEVLKVLRETYLGQVKMIYIDPPYNTGKDFVYKDRRYLSQQEMDEKEGKFDEYGNLLFTNSDSNGRFHTDWLNFIYPRLKVARDLLTDDGVIFISIDDKEVDNLIKISNEIFGEYNFVGNIIWQSRTSISNDDEISTNHNHTLVYSKNRELLTFGGDDIDSSEYINPDNDPRGPWKLVPIDANHVGGDTSYPITNPKTGVDYYPPNGRIWCYNKSTLDKLMADGRIKFGLSDESSPKRKLFLKERQENGDSKTPSSILLDAGTTKSGTVEIMALFDNEKVFDYPKPTTLITRLMKYGYVRNNDIVLDFFSGSGTTAHAAMTYACEQNISLHYILVQIAEDLDRNLELASNDVKKSLRVAIEMLDKIAKPHFLTEIAKERIRRAGKKIKEEAGEKGEDLDIGFRVLKLDTSNMKDVFYNPSAVSQLTIDDMIDNVKEGRKDEDLLFQVMLQNNIPVSARIEKISVNGHTAYVVDEGALIATFDRTLDDDSLVELAKMEPMKFVMREPEERDGVNPDNLIDNFEQKFELYSPNTQRSIL